MGLLEKIKAARAAAMKTDGKTKVKGTMSSEIDGRNYTSKGVVKSKTNSLNKTTKTVTKLKGRGYDTPLKSSRQVVVTYNDGTVKRTGGNTKFKKGYEAKPVLSLKTKPVQELPTKKITPTIQIPAPRNEPTMGYTKKMGQTPMQKKLMLAKEKLKETVTDRNKAHRKMLEDAANDKEAIGIYNRLHKVITPPKSYISKEGKNVPLLEQKKIDTNMYKANRKN